MSDRKAVTELIESFSEVKRLVTDSEEFEEILNNENSDVTTVLKKSKGFIDQLYEVCTKVKNIFYEHYDALDNSQTVSVNSEDVSVSVAELCTTEIETSSDVNNPNKTQEIQSIDSDSDIALNNDANIIEPLENVEIILEETNKDIEINDPLENVEVILKENGDTNLENNKSDEVSKNSEPSNSDASDTKPLIRLVDLSKLMEPNRNKANVDSTVIILSSSDEEGSNQKQKVVKKDKSVSKSSSKENSNNSITKLVNQKSTNKTHKSDLSKRKHVQGKSSDEDNCKQSKVDDKYQHKVSIHLPLVECQKLKQMWLKNKDLFSIESCKSLSNKRPHKPKISSKNTNKKLKIITNNLSDEDTSVKKSSQKINEKNDSNSSATTSKKKDADIKKKPDSDDKHNKRDPHKSNRKINPEENCDKSDATTDDEIVQEKVDKGKSKVDESEDTNETKKLSSTMETSNTDNSDAEITEKDCTQKKDDRGSDTEIQIHAESDIEQDKNTRNESNSDEEKRSDVEIIQRDSTDSDTSNKQKSNEVGEEKKANPSESDEEEEIGKKKSQTIVDDESNSDDQSICKQKTKKKKKKIVLSDSDVEDGDKQKKSEDSESSSSDSSDTDEEISAKKTAAKKRIKRTKDNSSSSNSEEEVSTRKQIRKLIGKNALSETTKQAEEEEKERKARIAEKQKKYNRTFEETKDTVVEKVILDYDEKTKEPRLSVHKKIVENLKPHQVSGIQFMYDACFESLERIKKSSGSGCILAHCMGLGKTLQVISLVHTLLVNSDKTKVERVLVVCPINTVLNWKAEFKKWVPSSKQIEVYELATSKKNYEREYTLKEWFNEGGVLIIGYSLFRTISNPKNGKIPKKMRNSFQECLVDPGPDLVICDEGHLLKNEKTNLSIAMNRIKTARRIVLTGTPLQNNLKEYWCMVQFIKPNLLGTYKEYMNRFVNPITNGQYTDSTHHDTVLMRKRSHVLHKLLDGVVQRRDYAVLEPYLPPKYEYVLFVRLSETQTKLYKYYMDHLARQNTGSNRTSFLFNDYQNLQRIGVHPRVLLDKSTEKKEKYDDEEESEGSLKDFIDDGAITSSDSSSSSSDSDSDKSSHSNIRPSKRNPKLRITRAQRSKKSLKIKEHRPFTKNQQLLPWLYAPTDIELQFKVKRVAELGIEEEEEVVEQRKEWWQEFCDGEELDNITNSGKLSLLFEIIKECEEIGDKLLVFSQSLYTLNCIEYFLNQVDEATQKGETKSGYTGTWELGLDYFRLDGSSSCDNRAYWCDSFNNPDNTRSRLFLISTKAGGLGINLVAANRVIIFDVSWNPSHDIQSIYRVYRFGQTKPSYIYRFVNYGCMEMKIYERQVTKQAISKRVIDEQQIDRHYNQNDLQELYKCDLEPAERPIPLVPKDILLGEMLQKYDKIIYKYHIHQSLLENKTDEGLNEEERKAAWEEFENEKVLRKTTATPFFGNPSIASLGVNANAINSALMNIVKRDNPLWSESQIKGIIPALVKQLQVQIEENDMSMYHRVVQEIQNQARLKESLFQQQMLRLYRQQMLQSQQNALLGNLDINPQTLQQLYGVQPTRRGPSNGAHFMANNASTSSQMRFANDVIELND